jgi:hypothetical protein
MPSRKPRLSATTPAALVAASALLLVAMAPAATAAAPTSKDLIFFLHYVADPGNASKTLPGAGSTLTYFDTTTEWNNTNATFTANGSSGTFFWYLVPPLAGPMNLTGFSLAIWAQSLAAGSSNAQTTVEIWERNSTGAESQVTSANFGSQSYSNTPELKQLNSTLGPPHQFAAGSSIKVLLKLTLGTGSLEILFDTARADSRIVLVTVDSLSVSNSDVTDSAGNAVASLEPTASNTTAHFRATLTDPFGGYDVVRANLTLMSPLGATILDNVSVPRVSGSPVSLETVFDLAWNYSGRPSGEYTVAVYAMDNSGLSWFNHFAQFDYGPYGDSLSRTFFIGSLPLFAWIKVVDDHAVPLAGASVRLESAGSPVASGSTDAAGLLNLTAFAGNYTANVTWAGVQVASVPLSLTDNVSIGGAIAISAAVYYPTIKVTDSRGAAVDHAFVYLTYPNGTSTVVPFTTDANGSIALSQVTVGSMPARVLWRGVEVAEPNLAVSSSGLLAVSASVYYLAVQVNDGAGEALSLALVRMDDAVFGLLSVANVTGPTGRLEERLPAGTYDLSVNWRGVDVGVKRGQALTADASVTVQAAVFALTVKAVASDGTPLAGATVTVSNAAGAIYEVAVTGADGTAKVRAPGGTYSVSGHYAGTAYWSSIDQTEGASGITLDQAKTVELKFTQAPGSFVGSNMFLAIVALLALLAVLVFLRVQFSNKVAEIKSQHAGMGAQAEAKPGETKQEER